MNDFNRSYGARDRAMDMSTDAGLRTFMLGVYNKLAMGIALAGIVAYAAGSIAPLTEVLYGTSLRWVVMLAPVGLILFSNFAMRRPTPGGTAAMYWAIVVAMGLSMGIYFAMARIGLGGVSHMVIAKAFFVTAAMFGGLSLFGYTTKKDLGPIGTFAMMALWGTFIIGMVFFVLPMIFPGLAFLQSSTMQMIISGGFALFSAVLIAWQTQSLKEGYYQFGGNADAMAVATNWGALNFFISFVNIFQFVLRMMSSD